MTETLLLLDNSAWARLADPRSATIGCPRSPMRSRPAASRPACRFFLDAGYSARNARDHDELLAELLVLPRFSIDEDVERRALEAQCQLARVGHYRLPPVDLLVAALADRHGLDVLHYDRDYDLVTEKMDLDFESVWLAPAGTL